MNEINFISHSVTINYLKDVWESSQIKQASSEIQNLGFINEHSWHKITQLVLSKYGESAGEIFVNIHLSDERFSHKLKLVTFR